MQSTSFLPGLSPVQSKSLTAAQDAGNLSSNGGAIVLREAAMRLGLADVIAGPLPETRNPLLVTHSYADMVMARMIAIACGYEDADDLDDLRHDPALKIACGRAPDTGSALPSQPTISRMENLADLKVLYRIGINNIDLFCRSYTAAPAAITLDIDDTDDRVHGGQQLALFNTHAGGHCFQPIHIFEGNSGKPILSLIRPGKRPSGAEIARVLRHVIYRIRRRWRHVKILVRGDGHYCAPEVLDLLRKQRCDYILGLPTNRTLEAHAAPWHERCRMRWKPSLVRMRRFHQLKYAAGSWSRQEKVIARVEATALGTDARFIVTNLQGRAKVLYEKVYCARGRMENLIKDLKLYTRSDKTACHRWQANQFRLFLHQGAYWLLHSVRLAAPKKSRWRGATFATIRNLLVKISCRVEELRTRIKLSFPPHLPHAADIALIAARLCPQAP
ncbi:IS1380 family transposase [Hyphomicrobium sp. DMF-1]|uniref:IS1380 family transposase n=1 Tax=Hyphomicrobium sp. DMF-1 TaxID=3019544 RepID=UPI0022EBECC1|nr:IS1380 family transposase [Hyphomicrobium sp. DMF-1]WBT39063.1 IS1380 family transposase [Hyphomicrobium sp. DMF-1]